MGKRELLIVAAFGILGVVIYQLTAPTPRAGGRRFSLAMLTDAWRRQAGGPQGRADVTTTGSIARPPGGPEVEVKVSGATNVIVVGEARATVEWTLRVQATGQDDEAARRLATTTTMTPDDLGSVLALAVKVPPGARPAVTLTLRVPSREMLRVDGSMQATISGIAGLRFESASGDTTVRGIAGPVTGAHRNGALAISDVGTVTLSTVGTSLTLEGIRGESSLITRNGTCRVSDAVGPVGVDATAGSVTIERPRGPVRLTGTNGLLTVSQPHAEVRLDARSARVLLALDLPVPVTATTTDAAMQLTMTAGLAIELDAAVDHGAISAAVFGLTPEIDSDGARLRHRFDGTTRVTLRNTRGAIEITRMK